MTLSEVITNIDGQSEEAIIFAKKINERFSASSEALVVELNEEELGAPTKEIADRYCPGFNYFLEVFLVKDMMKDLKNTVGYKSSEQQIDRIIHYAEFDA